MYTNISNPQTIYARVTLAGTAYFEVFEIGLNVENCGTAGCTELDMDNILKECRWSASINNSNDFAAFEFFFKSDNNLVIEGYNSSTSGIWTSSGGAGNPVLNVTELTGDFEGFNAEWKLVECSNTQLIFHDPENRELVLERNCN